MDAQSVGAMLGLGFMLGMKHATDADHVVAVTTIVGRSRPPTAAGSRSPSVLWASAQVGALWGIGHTLTLLVVGGAIILFHLVMPPHIGLALEFAVAGMLVALGVYNLRPRSIPQHTHDEPRPSKPRVGLRPLGIGLVHGLAGSAAIALLVLGTIQKPALGVLYLLVFCAGTVGGMMLLTAMISVPVAVAASRSAKLSLWLGRFAGLLSVGLGLFLMVRIGFVDGLFSATPSWRPQ
jgi:hypothetical protein